MKGFNQNSSFFQHPDVFIMILNSTQIAPVIVLEHFLRFFKYLASLEKIEDHYVDYANKLLGFIIFNKSDEGNVNATMNLISLCWAEDKYISKVAQELTDLWINNKHIFPQEPRDDFAKVKKMVKDQILDEKIQNLLKN
jgi:hypothetical protein